MFSSICGVIRMTCRGVTLREYCSSTWNNPNEIKIYPWKKHFRINKTRCYFPRPSENMRIKKHGWDTRMSTEGGRKVLMNRILKGRHVLSH